MKLPVIKWFCSRKTNNQKIDVLVQTYRLPPMSIRRWETERIMMKLNLLDWIRVITFRLPILAITDRKESCHQFLAALSFVRPRNTDNDQKGTIQNMRQVITSWVHRSSTTINPEPNCSGFGCHSIAKVIRKGEKTKNSKAQLLKW